VSPETGVGEEKKKSAKGNGGWERRRGRQNKSQKKRFGGPQKGNPLGARKKKKKHLGGKLGTQGTRFLKLEPLSHDLDQKKKGGKENGV